MNKPEMQTMKTTLIYTTTKRITFPIVEIAEDSLVVGKKYIIIDHQNVQYTGYFNTMNERFNEFKDTRLFSFSRPVYAYNHFLRPYMCYKPIHTYKYYEPITKKLVQEQMEKRALDMILRNLLGDDFSW